MLGGGWGVSSIEMRMGLSMERREVLGGLLRSPFSRRAWWIPRPIYLC